MCVHNVLHVHITSEQSLHERAVSHHADAVLLHTGKYEYMHACMCVYACMYACMYACAYVCAYVCVFIYMYVY